jgi:hypothetical protein
VSGGRKGGKYPGERHFKAVVNLEIKLEPILNDSLNEYLVLNGEIKKAGYGKYREIKGLTCTGYNNSIFSVLGNLLRENNILVEDNYTCPIRIFIVSLGK